MRLTRSGAPRGALPLEADQQRSSGQRPGRQALSEILTELHGHLADPKAAEKREQAARRISAAQVLGGRVGMTRRHLDGTMDAARADMRRRFSL